MSESDFLTAIIADPADDVRRMAFADWLDEHDGDVECPDCWGAGCPYCGGPDRDYHTLCCDCGTCDGSGRVPNGYAARAEFVRVQCELAGMQPLAEVMVDPVNGDVLGKHLVSGCLLGDPSGVTAGAIVEWRAEFIGGTGYYVGTGIVESLDRDQHGLRVEVRPTGDTTKPPAGKERRDALRRRERELFNVVTFRDLPKCMMDGTWYLENNPDGIRPGSNGMFFRRGFIDSVTLTAADWTAHGDAIRAAQPVTKVTLTTWPALTVYEVPDMRTVIARYLSLENNIHRGTVTIPEAELHRAEPDGIESLFRVKTNDLLRKVWPGIAFELPPTREEVLNNALAIGGIYDLYPEATPSPAPPPPPG